MPVVIGILMLMGIVTKNAIMLVDFAVEEIGRGMPRHEAIVDAGRKRARPIVMTTIAMAAGMLPSALALGDGGEFRAPMAIAVIGGLIVSTLLAWSSCPRSPSWTIVHRLWCASSGGSSARPGRAHQCHPRAFTRSPPCDRIPDATAQLRRRRWQRSSASLRPSAGAGFGSALDVAPAMEERQIGEGCEDQREGAGAEQGERFIEREAVQVSGASPPKLEIPIEFLPSAAQARWVPSSRSFTPMVRPPMKARPLDSSTKAMARSDRGASFRNSHRPTM